MRIKMIATEICKAVNVCRGYLSCGCNELITDLQLFKIFFERVYRLSIFLRVLLIHIGYCSNSCWRTLYCGSLQVMFYSTYTTHFFSTSCPAGPTMNQ